MTDAGTVARAVEAEYRHELLRRFPPPPMSDKTASAIAAVIRAHYEDESVDARHG